MRCAPIFLAFLLILNLAPTPLNGQAPVEDAFTYQGRLLRNGSPAQGNFDFVFRLFDGPDASSGIKLATTGPLTVPVSAGLFSIELDFGPGVFNGDARWLEIQVAPAGTGDFETLTPFQPITAAPYALHAIESGFAFVAGDADLLDGMDSSEFLTSEDIGTNLTISGTLTAGNIEVNNRLSGGSSEATGGFAIAYGAGSTAGGLASAAWGKQTTASAESAASFGLLSIASGAQAVAMGDSTQALGDNSLALGEGTTAFSYGSVVMGRYNEGTGVSKTVWDSFDPVFVIGNGADSSNRANAITVLKNGRVGVGVSAPNELLHIAGRIQVDQLGGNTANNLCINNGVLAFCSSSQRYKDHIRPLPLGLEAVQQLRPVVFEWKDRGEPDLGLVAEEVEEVDPLLVTYHEGRVEGIKYDQLTAVLVRALQEQQEEIDELRRLVCLDHPGHVACRAATSLDWK